MTITVEFSWQWTYSSKNSQPPSKSGYAIPVELRASRVCATLQVRCPFPTTFDGGSLQATTIVDGTGFGVDEAAKLEQVQRAAKKDPLQLIKPVDTRWNSVYDTFGV